MNVPGLPGTVRLAPTLEAEMVKLSRTVLETISKLTEEQQRDGHLVRSRDQLRKYLERLQEPGARNIVLLLLACLQRVVLECYARCQWLQRWVPRLKNVDFSFALDCDIMGAFTSDLGIAADLFRVGIPLWLVRPLQQQPLARIDRLVAPLDEEWSEKLRLRSLDTVDVSHERPPHPLIYVGLPGSFKRYARMAIFIHRQFAVSLVGTFGSGESTTPSGSLIPLGSVARSSATSSSLSSAVQTKLSEMESLDVTLRDWIAPPPPKPKAPPKKKQKLGVFSFGIHTLQLR